MQISDDQIGGALFSHIITKKLDNESKEKFKMSQSNKIPSIDETLQFLQNRVQFLLDIDADNVLEKGSQAKFNHKSKSNLQIPNKHITLLTNGEKAVKCIFCGQQHYLPDCDKFKNLTVENRIKKVTTLQTCKNCLEHSSKYNCKSKTRCEHCSKFHNTLLHKTEKDELRATKDDLTPKDELQVEPIPVCNYDQNKALTLLPTAKVEGSSKNNLINRELASKLKLYQNK
ncbi:hypothetical protein ILUMI_14999, partial [Ignelater luminosus]